MNPIISRLLTIVTFIITLFTIVWTIPNPNEIVVRIFFTSVLLGIIEVIIINLELLDD